MGQLTLVLGGVRSGKSRFAEQLASAVDPVTYLATARVGDGEMDQRIALHRQRRPPDWRTVEEPWEVAQIIRVEKNSPGTILLECVTLWLTNLLVGIPGKPPLEEGAILTEVWSLTKAVHERAHRVIIVTNEVGMGIMPVNDLARRFGDLLGEANQCLAGPATEVYSCMAGIPLRIR